jgi:hypothetical protein
VAFIVFAFNAFISFVIFALGVGVPATFHRNMGLGFFLLNVIALVLFVSAPNPKPITRILLFVGVIPLEIASVALAAYICELSGYQC